MKPRPLIVFDTTVILHQIVNFDRDSEGQIINHMTNTQLYNRIKDGVDMYNTLFFLPGIDPSRCDIIWAGDSLKGYWRKPWFDDWLDAHPEVVERLRKGFEKDITGEYLPTSPTSRRKPLRLGYKASRTSCPYRQFAKSTINNISNAVVYNGYEADDIAAAVTKIFTNREIYLCSIDTDWLQLVKPTVKWICMKGYSPQLRGVDAGMDWFRTAISKGTIAVKEEFADLRDLSQIVDWKMFAGDSSDNLPKGSPREVIDLLSPPEEFRLWMDKEKRLEIRSSLKRGHSRRSCFRTQDRIIDNGFFPTTPPVLSFDWSSL